jgi:hypothetical protein
MKAASASQMAGEAVKGDDAATITNEYSFTGRQVTSRSLESGVKGERNLLVTSGSSTSDF